MTCLIACHCGRIADLCQWKKKKSLRAQSYFIRSSVARLCYGMDSTDNSCYSIQQRHRDVLSQPKLAIWVCVHLACCVVSFCIAASMRGCYFNKYIDVDVMWKVHSKWLNSGGGVWHQDHDSKQRNKFVAVLNNALWLSSISELLSMSQCLQKKLMSTFKSYCVINFNKTGKFQKNLELFLNVYLLLSPCSVSWRPDEIA